MIGGACLPRNLLRAMLLGDANTEYDDGRQEYQVDARLVRMRAGNDPPRPEICETKRFEDRADAIGQLLLYSMAKRVPKGARLRIHLFAVPNRERRTLVLLAGFVALCKSLSIEVRCEPTA